MNAFLLEAGLFFVLGATIGSFLNVIIYRWPREESFVSPRSRCPHCATVIPFYFNVPILGWCILRGRANCCGKKISPSYPLVEFLSGVLFAFTFYRFGWSFQTLEYCLFVSMALPCFFIDLKHYLLPDILTYPGMFLGVLGSLFSLTRTLPQSVLGLVVGGGFFWMLSWLYEKTRKQEGMGFGDVKLLAWLGALGGVQSVFFVAFFSSLMGAFFGLILIVFKSGERNTAIPFGPFLIGAAFLYYYFYEELVSRTGLFF